MAAILSEWIATLGVVGVAIDTIARNPKGKTPIRTIAGYNSDHRAKGNLKTSH